ncbi:MAG: iron transporter [Alphaproteobacteria bacterium]|nr:iron transporter [Alphaproteobacteria bacterium]
MKIRFAAATALALTCAFAARAAEVPIGEPVEKNGMQIAAIYLQAVTMEPQHAAHANTDVHLEADIHAIKGNENGFGEGEWIPYLGVSYELTKQGSSWKASGVFVPMVASDGPHYGQNIKLDGPGKYHLTYRIESPASQGFLRHTDKETGVGKWWEPFSLGWDFTYVGTGKKGGY